MPLLTVDKVNRPIRFNLSLQRKRPGIKRIGRFTSKLRRTNTPQVVRGSLGRPLKIEGRSRRLFQPHHHVIGKPANPVFKLHGLAPGFDSGLSSINQHRAQPPVVLRRGIRHKSVTRHSGACRMRHVRRTCAAVDQIQFLLRHVSVQTTKKCLGCKQRLRNALTEPIVIEPNSCASRSK